MERKILNLRNTILAIDRVSVSLNSFVLIINTYTHYRSYYNSLACNNNDSNCRLYLASQEECSLLHIFQLPFSFFIIIINTIKVSSWSGLRMPSRPTPEYLPLGTTLLLQEQQQQPTAQIKHGDEEAGRLLSVWPRPRRQQHPATTSIMLGGINLWKLHPWRHNGSGAEKRVGKTTRIPPENLP